MSVDIFEFKNRLRRLGRDLAPPHMRDPRMETCDSLLAELESLLRDVTSHQRIRRGPSRGVADWTKSEILKFGGRFNVPVHKSMTRGTMRDILLEAIEERNLTVPMLPGPVLTSERSKDKQGVRHNVAG